jgi:hypothetical protein
MSLFLTSTSLRNISSTEWYRRQARHGNGGHEVGSPVDVQRPIDGSPAQSTFPTSHGRHQARGAPSSLRHQERGACCERLSPCRVLWSPASTRYVSTLLALLNIRITFFDDYGNNALLVYEHTHNKDQSRKQAALRSAVGRV